MPTNPRHETTQARAIWPPVEGYFEIRLVPRGWAVPALIRRTEHGWQAVVDGRECDPHPDPERAEGVARVWHYGRRVEPGHYDWLMLVAEHARRSEPDHPAANPRKPINPRTLRPLAPRNTRNGLPDAIARG